jgi:sensor histidine kinase YesM
MRIFFKKASPVKLQFLIWGFVFLFTFLTYLPEDGLAQALTYGLMNIAFYALMIYGNISFLFPRLYLKGRVAVYTLAAICLLAGVGAARAMLSVTVYNSFFAKQKETLNFPTFLYYTLAGLVVFMLSFVFRIAIDYFRVKRQAEQMLEQKSQAELNLLKSQVQPHFLFNTLNNIYYEAYREAPRTAKLIERLSDIMRYFVDESPKDEVSLQTEVQFIENYIALEKIRIRHETEINFVKDYNGEARIPPMLLMTFAENIFKHGIDKSSSNNRVDISLIHQDGFLLFQTSNQVPGNQSPGASHGFGIQNLRKRLTLLYGTDFELNVDESDNHFTAFLKVPLA